MSDDAKDGGGYPAMTLTEAVKAVNEAGFTIRIDRNYFDSQPGLLGFFRAGDGSYEVVNTVEGIDGYVVQGMCGVVAPGVMTSPDEVMDALGDREPEAKREYVDVEQYLGAETNASA